MKEVHQPKVKLVTFWQLLKSHFFKRDWTHSVSVLN